MYYRLRSALARAHIDRPWPTTRRGLVLWFFAWAFVSLGSVNFIATDLPTRSERSLGLALTIMPATAWGILMVAFGLVAIFTSYCNFGRDRYGYVILATFCAAWGTVYLTGPLYGAGLRSAGGAVIWLLFAAVLVTCAGFPNVRLTPPPRFTDHERTDVERSGE